MRGATKGEDPGIRRRSGGLRDWFALDEQPRRLGFLNTTWTILKGNHKGSGLSANIINRMFLSPRLPPPVRAKLWICRRKGCGLYGDSKVGCRQVFDSG